MQRYRKTGYGNLPQGSAKTAPNWRFGFKLSRNFIVLVAVLLAVIFGIGIYAQYTLKLTKKYADKENRAIELSGTIGHLDEVLTMSAQMAATTGEAKWEKRYRNFAPGLDSAIKEAIGLVDNDLAYKAAAKTAEANAKLAAMQDAVFGAIDQGNIGQALKILNGPRYKAQRIVYNDGMSQFVLIIRNEAERQLAKVRRMVWGTFISVVLVVVTLLFFCIILMHTRHRLVERRRNEEQLTKAKNKTEKSEQELLKTVEELEKFNKLAVGRELRMAELKNEVDSLLKEMNKPEKYSEDYKKIMSQLSVWNLGEN